MMRDVTDCRNSCLYEKSNGCHTHTDRIDGMNIGSGSRSGESIEPVNFASKIVADITTRNASQKRLIVFDVILSQYSHLSQFSSHVGAPTVSVPRIDRSAAAALLVIPSRGETDARHSPLSAHTVIHVDVRRHAVRPLRFLNRAQCAFSTAHCVRSPSAPRASISGSIQIFESPAIDRSIQQPIPRCA